MKHYKRTNTYKNGSGSLTFNANTLMGYSYDWYCIARPFKNSLLINSYNYSNTTSKHIHKISALARKLGFNTLFIEAPQGLNRLNTAKDHYENLIHHLQCKIDSPKTPKQKNKECLEMIQHHQKTLSFIENLIKDDSLKE